MNDHSKAKSASESTRREFIRKVGKKTLYTVPLIVTFAKADLASAATPPVSGASEGSAG